MTELTPPTPNIPLLRKAVEWAEAEAAKTDGTTLWNQAAYALERDCGTAYCIAGWTVAIAEPSAQIVARPWSTVHINGVEQDFEDIAARHLGLTVDEAWELFQPYNDIERVREVAEEIAARAGERL